MKKFILISFLGIGALFTIESCNNDDPTPVTMMLVTSHQATGKFYKMDKTTGTKTEVFTVKEGTDDVTNFRSLVYHPGKNLLYGSLNNNFDAVLYSIDPSTKIATLINDNDQGKWDSFGQLFVAADDSLLAVGYFDDGGFMKFGTTGNESSKITTIDNLCCGMGSVYDPNTKIINAGTYPDTGGEVRIVTADASGSITGTKIITDLIEFPADTENDDFYVRSMAKDTNGTIYAIIFNYDKKDTYFSTINLSTNKITWISTLGESTADQYMVLAFIPE